MGESTETIANSLSDSANSLSDSLTRHKSRRGIGDAKIASLASDRVGIEGYVTRSTVRNWATGSSASVNNWRQLALIASTLQLSLDEADELMVAGGCDKISALLRFARDEDAPYLTYWHDDVQLPDSFAETPEVHVPVDVTVATTQGAEVSAALSPAVPDDVAAPQAPTLASQPPAHRAAHRSGWVLWAPGLVLLLFLLAALAALAVWFVTSQASTVVQVSSGDRTLSQVPPTTTVDLPVAGSTIKPGFIVAGTAEHASGVDYVKLILKDLDEKTYWNPVAGVWQTEFVQFIVPVEPDSSRVAWEYRLPVPVPSGEYRARAWALSKDGDDDPIGPMSNFFVETDVVIDLEEGASAAPDGPNQLFVPPPDDGFPRSTLDAPGPAETVAAPVTVRGTATDPNGIAYVEIIFRNLDEDRYWNPEIDAWQDEFTRFAIAVDEPGNTDVSWSFEYPESLVAGEYRARVWATSSIGEADEERTLSDFFVE